VTEPAYRCGYVAVVGRPNVGKSTLVNALVGTRVSIVTAKPQTTRHRVLGVMTTASAQVVFVDTPGLHRTSRKAMNRMMNRTALSALTDADLVLFVTDAARWTDEDEDVLSTLGRHDVPVVAVLNKVDTVHPKPALLVSLEAMSQRHAFADLVPVSATRGSNLDALRSVVVPFLPESPALFPEHMQTDRSPAFRAAEVVREKLMLMLHQELPYGASVQVDRYDDADEQVAIDAIIWVERESQKGIVVGKGGRQLKHIGQAARLDLKEQLGRPVHLELWVKVRENWADSESELLALGFDPV